MQKITHVDLYRVQYIKILVLRIIGKSNKR